MNAAIARCHHEIEEYTRAAEREDKPAWLVTLGTEDWLMEIRLIQAEECLLTKEQTA